MGGLAGDRMGGVVGGRMGGVAGGQMVGVTGIVCCRRCILLLFVFTVFSTVAMATTVNAVLFTRASSGTTFSSAKTLVAYENIPWVGQ